MNQVVCDYCQKPLDKDKRFGRLLVMPEKTPTDDLPALFLKVMEGSFDICGACVDFVKPSPPTTVQ